MPSQTLEVLVRKAARALGRHGLVHAYGHVSARIDEHTFLVCAPEPMGLIAPGTPGTVVAVDGDLPDGVLGEVRIHREIYRRRPEVRGVARTMPPKIMSLSNSSTDSTATTRLWQLFLSLYSLMGRSASRPQRLGVRAAGLADGRWVCDRHAGQWAGHGGQKRGGSRCPRLVCRRCGQGRNGCVCSGRGREPGSS